MNSPCYNKDMVVSHNPISRGKIARDTGVSVSHVSRVISKNRRPSIHTTQKLSVALGLSMDEFIKRYDAGTLKELVAAA